MRVGVQEESMFTVEKLSILRTFDNLWLGLKAVVTLLGRRAGQGLEIHRGRRGSSFVMPAILRQVLEEIE